MTSIATTVLVIDDDPAIRVALRELLETEGYRVAEAVGGTAALARLRGGLRPDVILLDLMMPPIDGWDFRREQLGDPALKDIPVIIITAAGFSLDTVRAQFGDVECFYKPLQTDALLAAIGRAGHRRGTQQGGG